MSSLPTLDRMRTELVRSGLPSEYIERLMGELDDHVSDLEKENVMSTEAIDDRTLETRLGTAEELAACAATNYQRRRFLGRHPVLAFLIAPIPLTLVGWTAFLLLGFGFFQLCPYVLGDAFELQGKTVDQWPRAAVWSVWAFHYATRIVPPIIAAGLLCYLAHRSGVNWRWAILATALVAIVAGSYHSTMRLPVEPGNGQYSIGLGLGAQMFLPPQLIQLVLTLAVGVAFTWYWWRKRPTLAA
jgi:hypothetical protein